MRFIILCILLVTSQTGLAQKIEYVLSTPNDTSKNYYIIVHPPGEVKGSLILLPGFGELPTQTLINCGIYKYSANAGYLTIIPALGDWSFLYFDLTSQKSLDEFIVKMFDKYNLNEKSFFIGGFSAGGTMAIRYAERAYENNTMLKRPAGVFGVDPPLDLERLYNTMTDKGRKLSEISIRENEYISKRIEDTFETNPKENPQYFWTVSPFSRSDTSRSALKPILNLPVRIYNDPDINWHIENRYADYSHMNVFDSAAMINWLKILGNKEAELIIAIGKGYRIASKERHPHSWTIADGNGVVQWMNNITARKQ